jgi:hypothetical protein
VFFTEKLPELEKSIIKTHITSEKKEKGRSILRKNEYQKMRLEG